MKKFNFKRMLLLAVMLMTLTCVVALTAFAEITGGDGAFVGSDYVDDTFATYTMNGLTMEEGTYETLTVANNTGLAGLYMVKENGGAGKIVYVRGKALDRQNLASAGVVGSDNTTGNNWGVPGKVSNIGHTNGIHYKVGYTQIIPGSHKGYVTGYPKIAFVQNHTYQGQHFTDPAILIRDGEITKADYAAACALFSFKYSLKTEEIIPATEFNSFTYGLSRRGTIDVGSTDTKLLVLVYDAANKAFKTFEAIDDVKTGPDETGASYTATSKHTIEADKLVLKGGTTKLSELGADNYIVGYEIFPAVNVNANTLEIADSVYAQELVIPEGGTETEGTLEYTYKVPGAGYNNFHLTIFYDEYDIDVPTESASTGVTYDAATNKLSGLTGGRNYYVAPYDANGVDKDAAVALSVATDGTATVPTTLKGLTALYVKGNEYKTDSDPFIFWTDSDRAGKFSVESQKIKREGTDTDITTLLVPGEFRVPAIPSVGLYSELTYGIGIKLRGYTVGSMLGKNDGDGYEIYAVSGDHEALIPKAGIYYGFTSDEAFPIERFEQFDLSATNGMACQGVNGTKTYITRDNGTTKTLVTLALNGNKFRGHLVLYYVDENGTLGTYTINGTEQTTISFTNNVYTADKTALEALEGNYVIGYALLPYAEITYAAGQTSLFGNYTNSGGNAYIRISNNDGHVKEFGLSLPDFVGTATGSNGAITVPDSTKNYVISPVILANQELDGASETGKGGRVSELAFVADAWTLLNSTSNQNLAGLYKIAEADTSGNMTSSASYVYVNGKAADVQAIATTATGADNTVGTKWQVGKWIGIGYNGGTRVSVNTDKGYVTSRHDSHKAQVAGIAYKDIWFVQNDTTNFPNPAVLIGYTEDTDDTTDGKGVTRALYAEAVGKYSMKYALTDKEIIPATMFNSFTYGLSRTSTGSIEVGATNTKLQVLVYNTDTEAFSTYEAIASNKTSTIPGDSNNPTSKHTITADELTLVGGTTKLSALDANNYIVGYEIFPAVNVQASDVQLVNTANANQFYSYIYYNEYDIDVPKATKPTVAFAEATKVVSGLDASTTNKYYIVKLVNDGTTLVPDTATKVALATDAEGKADLGALGYKAGDFGIGAYGNDYILDSEYVEINIAAPDAPTFTYDSVAKEISGLEADTTDKYYAVQLGVNSTVTLMETVDATKVNLATDAEGKADLSALAAGLWGVGLNETSSSAASNYTVVYISGSYNQKQALGDIDSSTGKPATSGADDWQVGVWTGKLGYNFAQTIGKSYQLTNGGAHFSSVAMAVVGGGSVQDKLYQGTPTEKTAAQNIITADMNALSFKYAYMGEEIIPAADFESFTYRVGIRQGNTRLAAEDSNDNTNTKVVVYVANADNSITKYEKLINEPSMTIRALDGLSNEIVVTAADLMNGTDAISTSDGYIVAIQVFPVQITDPTELYTRETTYKPNGIPNHLNFAFNFEVLYNKYSFDVPKASINDGITYNAFDNAITGLTDTTKEYYLATYNLDGTNTDLNGDGTYYDLKLEGIVDGKWALTEDAPTGLVAVIAKGDDYTADSDPVIFYTPTKNAGHFNSVAGTQIPGVDTKAAGYYGTVGKLTYEATAPIFTGTPAASGLGGIKPSIYSSVTELAYQVIERKYTNTGIKVNDGTTEYTLYEEGALNGNMEDIAFFYGFESDEIFHVQDFKGLNISGATFLQGAAAKYAIACDPGEAGAILDQASGKYYRVLNGHVNDGASFKSMLTLYYLDLSDGTMKSVDFYTGAIAGTAASVNFSSTSDISSLNGYVLGFSLKPYQQIEKNGHETIFSHTLNFGGQCYWTIGEAAGNVAVNSRTNSMNVGEHIYAGEIPTDMGGLNGSFIASAANEAAYADKYFQAAPLEISADGLSLVAGAYGDVFQLNNTNINSNFQGLWMVRFCNAAGTAGGAPSDVVYFTGTNETRLQLGNLSADGKPAISSANTWQKGVWSGSITYIDGASLGNNYKLSNSGAQLPSMTMSALGSGSVQDMLYQGDVTQKAAAQTTVMNEINALSHKYAYMDEEIIPAKDFLSFTYKVGKRQGNICFASGTSTANTNTKLVVYVANPDKTITKYEKLVNEPTMKIYADNGLSNKIVVKAEDLTNGAQSLKESAGYVIGIEIFPIQITDATEISAKEPTYGSDPKQFLHGSLNVDVIYGDYTLRVIPEAPKFVVENALPADAVAGENYAYATITGLIPSYRYEMLVDAAADTWVDLPYYNNGTYVPGSTGMELHKSEYSIKVPVNTDGTKTETYVIRVKDSDLTTASPSVDVTVYYLDGADYEFASLENEEQIINFASDFVEVQADYTIDLIKKPWTQNIALNNLKLAAPKALVTFEGDGFKFVVRAEDINVDRTVHYYSFNVGLNGASRKDFYFDEMKALAGDKFVAEYMLDSLYELPFTKADLHIYVGEEHNGKTLELRSYYEEIGRLRKWADADVDDGWIVFNLYDQAYVIYDNN